MPTPVFDAGATIEGFEGLSAGANIPLWIGGFGFLTPGTVGTFTFASGLILTSPVPASSGTNVVGDFAVGNSEYGLGINGVILTAANVLAGTAYFGANVPNGDVVFTLPFAVNHVGVYADANIGSITLTAYDALGALITSSSITSVHVASWGSNFLEVSSASNDIAKIEVSGSYFALDNLTFQAADTAPIAGTPNINTDEDQAAFTVDLLAGSSDPDVGDSITLTGMGGLGLASPGLGPVLSSAALNAITALDNAIAAVDGTGQFHLDPSLFNYLQMGQQAVITLHYDVTDSHGASTPTTATITVDGVNDAPTGLAMSNASVAENAGGALVGTLSASDADLGDTLTYSVAALDPWFEVLNGNELHIKAGVLLDHEAHASLSTTLIATDSFGAQVTKLVTVNVTDLTAAYAISADAASHLERHSGNTDFTFTITRSGDTVGAATVDWAVSGAAVTGADFTGGSLPHGTASFANGETTQQITVHVHGDTTNEADESFDVSLSNNSDGVATLGAPASATILNDDWTASIGPAAPAAQFEGDNPNTTSFTYTVTRTGYLGDAADIGWSLNGSGPHPANAADFDATSGTVQFAAGSDTASITVTVQGDSHVEADESFTVSLGTPPTGGNIGTASASATIWNDDAGFSINDAGVTEGDNGTQTIMFTITREGYLGDTDAVHWTFVNDAYVPVDTTDFPTWLYAADQPFFGVTKDGYPIFAYEDGPAGPMLLRDTDLISFAPGEMTHTLTFVVNGDTWLEANDKFHIVLQDPTPGSEIVDGHGDGTGTLGNNDQVGTVGYRGTITGTNSTDSLNAPQQLNGYQFFSGPGGDTVNGYGYDNLIYGAAGADSIYGGDGHSMVDGGAGDDRLRMHGYLDTVYAGTGDDSVWGTEGTAKIDAGWGNDTVNFAGNSSLIIGNFGDDSIYGGDHSNTIYGSIGSDFISVVGWNNTIYGDDGELRRVGFTYADSIQGGDHDNTVFGGFGDDTIAFVGQRNVAHGEDDNDLITAGSGYDSAYGGSGDDTVQLAGWGNFVDGGDGNDVAVEPGDRAQAAFSYSGGAWHVKFGYNSGTDTLVNVETLRFAVGADVDLTKVLTTGALQQGDQTGNSILVGQAAPGGTDTLVGFGYNNIFRSGDANTSILGGAGNEYIETHGGDDTISVAGHNNVISTGGGNDRIGLTGGAAHDNFIDAGEGNNVVTGGTDGNNIRSGSGTDAVTVSGHNNFIRTGGGDDVINLGLGGGDNVDGGDGVDTVVYSGNAADYQVVHEQNGMLTVTGHGGIDHLTNVEVLQFANASVSTPALVPVGEHLPVLEDANPIDVLGNVLANDIPSHSGAPLVVTGFRIPGNPTLFAAGAQAPLGGGAFLSVAANGDVTLEQGGAFNGLAAGAHQSVTFSYTVEDGTGASAVGDASVELTGVNDAPVPTNEVLHTDAAAADNLGNVLANDHDPDSGDVLHVTGFNIGGHDYLVGQVATVNGSAQFTITAAGDVLLTQNHAWDGLPGGTAVSLDFTYTVNDRANGSGLSATGNASIDLHALPAVPVGSTNQSVSGNNQVLHGTAGDDVLTATGWHEVILAGDGNDVIDGGNGQSSIEAGDGNNSITVRGGADTINAGDGDNTLVGPDGQAHVHFGDGTESITLAGYGNAVEIGATTTGTVSLIVAGAGGASVTTHEGLGDGDVRITLAGHNNTVVTGDGDDTVSGSQGNTSITLGDGNNTVDVLGYGNQIFLGAGSTTVLHAGSGNDTVVSGGGFAFINLAGNGNVVDGSAGGTLEIHGGSGNSLYIAPTNGPGAELIYDFNLNSGDRLEFKGKVLADLSFQISGNDLLVSTAVDEVVTLVGLGNALAQANLISSHLIFA